MIQEINKTLPLKERLSSKTVSRLVKFWTDEEEPEQTAKALGSIFWGNLYGKAHEEVFTLEDYSNAFSTFKLATILAENKVDLIPED